MTPNHRIRPDGDPLPRRADRGTVCPGRWRWLRTPGTWLPISSPWVPASSRRASRSRKDTTGRRSFGSYRAEVFASGLAVLMMLGVGRLSWSSRRSAHRGGPRHRHDDDARGRRGRPRGQPRHPGPVALGRGRQPERQGCVPRGARRRSRLSGCPRRGRADRVDRVTGMGHLVALGIGAFVLLRAVGLGRQVLAVLAQHVPEGMDLATVEADLSALPGVDDVHDLHIWTLTSGMNVATAHLVACQDADTHAVLDAARVGTARSTRHRPRHPAGRTRHPRGL